MNWIRLARLSSPILGLCFLLAACAPAPSPAPSGAKEQPAAPTAKPAAGQAPTAQPAASAPTSAPQAAPAKPTSAPSKPAAEFRVVVGHGAEDVSLDPNLSIATNWQSLLSNVYDTLVVRGRDGKLAPSLAESWKTVDPTTWELALRKGVKFHNGEPFDANDVKFTLERVLNPDTKSQQNTYVGSIKEVQAVDPATVRIVTRAPDPLLVDNLQLVPIVSGRFVQDKGATALANGTNGTGPFRVTEWVKGDRLTMQAYPEHWRGAPKITTGVFRVVPEPAALTSALQAGEVDIAVNVPPDLARAIGGAGGFTIAPVQSQRSLYIVLDNTVKPLDDVRVRQALNYAVNVKELTDDLLLGFGEPIPTLLGSMYFGHNAQLRPYGYDPDRAKRLLTEAGYPDGFPLRLSAPTGRYPKDKEVAEAVAGQLGKLGVKVDLKISEWGTFLDAYRAHQLSPAYLIGFGTPVWDYTVAFRSYLLPANAQSYYRDEEIQKLVEQASSTVDLDQRRRLLEDINKRIYDDAAFLYLYLQQDIYGVSSRIDWTPRSDEKVWLYEVSPK